MDWGNDLEPTTKKNYLQQLIPRLGRRAGQSNHHEEGRQNDDNLDGPGTALSSANSARTIQVPVAPPRARKTGWADELKSAKIRSTHALDQEKYKKLDVQESMDDIPVIPDAEEIQDDNIGPIATAPSAGINRVAAYKELDTDLLKNASFAFLDNVNLSLLTEKLYSERNVQENDEVWTWESLFTQISSELNSEAQKKVEI